MLANNSNTIKYIGFSDSKEVEDMKTKMTTQIGVPRYWAPELFDCVDMKFDFKIDIW